MENLAQTLDDMARTLSALVPEGLKQAQSDLEQNFRAVMQSGFERMDLVTREEFDAQAVVLARTREKLEALERTVAELEDS